MHGCTIFLSVSNGLAYPNVEYKYKIVIADMGIGKNRISATSQAIMDDLWYYDISVKKKRKRKADN